MDKIQPIVKFLFVIGLMLVFVIYFSCNNDDEDNETNLLIGVWTVTDADYELSIEDISFVDYLVNIAGFTEMEAEEALDYLLAWYNFEGTLEFKADQTYVAAIGDNIDNGTWSLNSAGDKITFDAGTHDEGIAVIISLTTNTLVIRIEFIESEDIDDDPLTSDVDILISVVATFSK